MKYTAKNIEISTSEFDKLRFFIKESLDQAKKGYISPEEFLEAIDSCFIAESPLCWDDCVLVRAIKPKEPEAPKSEPVGQIDPKNLMSDYDIMTKLMKYSDEEAKEIIGRKKIQTLEELKLQLMAQNPQLLGSMEE